MGSLANQYITILADFSVFRDQVKIELARVARTTFTVRPSLDLTAFRAQYRIFAAVYLRDRTFSVTPHLGLAGATTVINAWITNTTNNMAQAGDRSGNAFGRGFSTRWKLILGAIVGTLPLLQPLLSILSSLIQAAGALGAALPLAIAGTGVIVGALVLSFHNLGKAVKGAFSGTPTKDEREALEKLSDSAKKFVAHLLEVRVKLKGFQEEIQEQFFKPFLAGFKQLTASPAIKILRIEMGLVAGIAGQAAAGISLVFAAAAKFGLLKDILVGVRSNFADLAGTLPGLTQTFLVLAKAAIPFVTALSVHLVSGLEKFNALIEKTAANGRLAQFFQGGLVALEALGSLLGSLGSIISSVFGAFAANGNTVVGILGTMAQRLAEFLKTAQGQEALKTLAHVLGLIGDVLGAVVVPLLPVVAKLVTVLGGPLVAAIDKLIGPLGYLVDLIASTWMPVMDAMAPVIDELVTVLADVLVQVIVELAGHIRVMMPFLQEMAARMGPELVPIVKALGEVLLALVPVIPAISRAMIDLMPLVIKLIPLFIDFAEAGVKLTLVFAQVITWTVQLISWMGDLNQIVMKLPIALKIVGDFFVAIWGHITDWFTGTIVPSFSKAVEDVVGFFVGLKNFFAGWIDTVKGWWDAFVGHSWFQDVVVAGFRNAIAAIMALFTGWRDGIVNVITGLRDGAFRVLTTLITQTVPDAFRSGVAAVGEAWQRIRQLAASPVSFVIDTVINRGIIDTFNKVSGFFKGPTFDHVSNPLGSIGTLRGDGYGQQGDGPGKDRTGDGLGMGDVLKLISGPAKWVSDRVGIGQLAAKFGSNPFTQMLTGGLGMVKDAAVDRIKELIGSGVEFLGGGGVSTGGLQAGITAVLALLRSAFGNVPVISGFRKNSRTLSGGISYHASGRAIDIAPVLPWALFLNRIFGSRLRELITPWNDLNIHNGRPHTYSGAVWNQHNFAGGNAHIHAAMDKGGRLSPGWNVVPNWTGRSEKVTSPGTEDTQTQLLVEIRNGIDMLAAKLAAVLTGTVSVARQQARAY